MGRKERGGCQDHQRNVMAHFHCKPSRVFCSRDRRGEVVVRSRTQLPSSGQNLFTASSATAADSLREFRGRNLNFVSIRTLAVLVAINNDANASAEGRFERGRPHEFVP